MKNILKNHFLFKSISSEGIELFLNNFLQVQIKSNYSLFREGDPGTFFYIIYKGEIEISVNGKLKRTKILREGNTFGEIALIQKSKRSASAICSIDAVLFYVDGHLIRQILTDLHKDEEEQRAFFLSSISIFSMIIF